MAVETSSSVNGKKPKTGPTERNPITEKNFKRDSWWQITFPVLVVTLLSIGLAVVLYFFRGAGGTSIIADYTLIILLIPALVVVLVVFGALVGLAVILGKAIRGIPPYTNSAQQFLQKTHSVVDKTSTQVASGVISARSAMMGVNLYLAQRAANGSTDGAGSKQTRPLPDTDDQDTGDQLKLVDNKFE